ncbi:hypothetical protein GVX82_01880 [Patescibacteria group bacterium]|jgi:hypothetical protein|nr:hypothetical protein [Patescibacteria group bacterium]
MAANTPLQHEIDTLLTRCEGAQWSDEDARRTDVDLDTLVRTSTPDRGPASAHDTSGAQIVSMRPTGRAHLPQGREERFKFLDAYYRAHGRLPKTEELNLRPRPNTSPAFVGRSTLRENPALGFLTDFVIYCHWALIEVPVKAVRTYVDALRGVEEDTDLSPELREEHRRIAALRAEMNAAHQEVAARAEAIATPETPAAAPTPTPQPQAQRDSSFMHAVERIDLLQFARIAFFSWLFTTTVLVVLQSFGVTSL